MYGQSLFFQVGHRYETCLHYLQLMPKGKRDVFLSFFLCIGEGTQMWITRPLGFNLGLCMTEYCIRPMKGT